MADQPIFKRDDVEGPGIHAFVIGVGHYPHLNGGGAKVMKLSDGMGQLTSAPHSARAFAAFLLEEWRDPKGRPLVSLRLHISEEDPQPFRHGTMAAPALPKPATIDEIDAAANAWFGDVGGDPDNVAIFFFSGHGVMPGLATALLLSDVGSKLGNPRDAAIRFDDFVDGMAFCQARSQIYFVDACRSFSKKLRDQWKGGRPLITEDAADDEVDYERIVSSFMATLAGEVAFGVKNSPSLYTQALLEALRGAGSSNADDEACWMVDTYTLLSGMAHLVEDASVRRGLDKPQIVGSKETSKLALHKIDGDPLVPIHVVCTPEDEEAELTIAGSEHAWRYSERPPFLPPGDCSLVARIVGPPALSGGASRSIRPPYVKFQISLEPEP